MSMKNNHVDININDFSNFSLAVNRYRHQYLNQKIVDLKDNLCIFGGFNSCEKELKSFDRMVKELRVLFEEDIKLSILSEKLIKYINHKSENNDKGVK